MLVVIDFHDNLCTNIYYYDVKFAFQIVFESVSKRVTIFVY